MQQYIEKLKLWMQQGTSILGASGALTVILAWATGAMGGRMAFASVCGCLLSFALPQMSMVDATALAGAVINKIADATPPGAAVSLTVKVADTPTPQTKS